MSVTIHIDYQGNLRCAATRSDNAQVIHTDIAQEGGGKGEYVSPTDLVAVAVGTCIMSVLGIVTQRGGANLDGLQIRVIKEMASPPIRRIDTLRVTIIMPPGQVVPRAERMRLERSVQACPVKQSLHPDVKVAIEFVYPDGGEA
jgi:putative redox protein